MKNFIKTTILLIGFALISVRCDDAVDIEPLYAQDADNYFKSANDYDRALTAAYDLLQVSYLDLWISEIASDNAIAGGESVTDSEGLHQIDDMMHGGVNNELRNLWRYMYAGITRTNFIFEFKDNLDFEGKDNLLGQASFLRAYYYFELVKFFGDVPLVIDRRLGADELTKLPRTPASEVYAQIEKDLTDAANVLDWPVTEKGRITKGAALSMLGKVYLYQNKFTEAASTLDQVINSNQYSLLDDVNAIFRVANEADNTETVFDIEYIGTEGGGYDCFLCLEGFAAVGFHSIRGYVGPIYADGNSYNLPTEKLVKAFDPADPRLEASILDIEAFKTLHPEVDYKKGAGGHTGYYNNKYIKRADELGLADNDLTSPVNHKVIRYADVLLMAAEAHNRKPGADDVLARKYLKEVRDRVGMSEIILSGNALTEAILHERHIEFAGEGLRFFDLVRTNKAPSEIAGFKAEKNELFPIPQAELDLARAGWAQNKGY